MNLRVVKSLNNGITVLQGQHLSLYREVGSALWMAGPGAPLVGIAKYLDRLGWAAVGNGGRSFTKGKVKVDVWDKAELPTNSAADGSSDANIVLDLSSSVGSLSGLARLTKASGGKPTLVVEPIVDTTILEVETETVVSNVRIRYSTQDLINDLKEYLRGKILERITPEEFTQILDARDVVNDPKSLIPISFHETHSSGAYFVSGKMLGNRTHAIGNYKTNTLLALPPQGSPMSFLTKNKTIEIVYRRTVVHVWGSAEQIGKFGPIFGEKALKAIKEVNADIYNNATYRPNN